MTTKPKRITTKKRGQPCKKVKRVTMSICVHPNIAAHLYSMGRGKSRFIEHAVCEKLDLIHPDDPKLLIPKG
jgi:hypothetical protein